MSDKSKEIIASNLTIAYFSGLEPRKGFLGEDRRKQEKLTEGQRDFRQGTITTDEVYQVFERFLARIEAGEND